MTADRDSRRGRPALTAVLVAFVVAVVAFFGFASPVSAQYVPGQPGITIDPPELPETGGSATIKGFGCPAASDVGAFIVVNGQEIPLGTAVAEDSTDGSFVIPVVIPPEAVGEYTILVRCEDLTLSTLVTLVPVPVPGTVAVTGALPTTGSDSTRLVQVAALLIAAGGFAALVARKRRTSHAR